MRRMWRSAEVVSLGHPDKFMDRVADTIVDAILRQDRGKTNLQKNGGRVAIEGVVKDNRLTLKGEVTAEALPDIETLVQSLWRQTYGDTGELQVTTYIQRQSSEIASMTDAGGAGDQGIMVGYATNETPEMLPLEFALARRLIQRMNAARESGSLDWLLADAKSQVTVDGDGKVRSVVLASHHKNHDHLIAEENGCKRMSDVACREVLEHIVTPVIADYCDDDKPAITFNGVGVFTVGGPHGDAGEVGRKIVVDAYGPRVPVGGGAYSGKDPTKVDRSGAYMARHIAKTIVGRGMAKQCLVHIAYAIGKHQPEMVTALTDSGEDLSAWARQEFDLAPWAIIERLGLWEPKGWRYHDTAAFGHYGRDDYPWEQIA